MTKQQAQAVELATRMVKMRPGTLAYSYVASKYAKTIIKLTLEELDEVRAEIRKLEGQG